ncbi:MAG: hypothetical protein ACTSRU_16055, partial [Candidatus Hodarchaeales archaeon]
GDYGAEIADTLSVISEYLSWNAIAVVVITILVLIALVFLVSLALTWIMSKIAAEVSVIMTLSIPVLIFIFAGVVFGLAVKFGENEIALYLGGGIAIIGILSLLIAFWKFKAIIRAGMFIEFAAELIIENKSLYIFPILIALSSAITFILGSVSGLWIMIKGDEALAAIAAVAGTTAYENQALIVNGGRALGLFVVEFFYLLFFFVLYYTLNGMIMAYAARWYQGEDPGPRSAVRDVRQVLPIIIKFATFTTIVHLILQAFRDRQKKMPFPLKQIFGFILWIVGAFYRFFTYFTLPAIVIRKKGFVSSAMESGKLVWKSGIDVLIGETGFGLVMFVFRIVNSLLWALVGFSVGAGLSEVAGGGLIQNIIIGFIVAIVFAAALSTLSMALIVMPMKSAFTCFLYCYAIDMEMGSSKATKLPSSLKSEFKTISKNAIDNNRRKMSDPTAE